MRRVCRFVTRAICLALVRHDSTRDVLGLWIETECANFWPRVVNDLKLSGLQDILIAVIDGPKGFPEMTVQTCITHLIRNLLNFEGWKGRKAVVAALAAFDAGPSGTKYSPSGALWRRAWVRVIRFFAFAPDTWKFIYTMDEIELLGEESLLLLPPRLQANYQSIDEAGSSIRYRTSQACFVPDTTHGKVELSILALPTRPAR